MDVRPRAGAGLSKRCGISEQIIRDGVSSEVAAEKPLAVAGSGKSVLPLCPENNVGSSLYEMVPTQPAPIVGERVFEVRRVMKRASDRHTERRPAACETDEREAV